MKRLRRAVNAFFSVLTADEYFVTTLKGNYFTVAASIKPNNLQYIVSDTIDDCLGEASALAEANELLSGDK